MREYNCDSLMSRPVPDELIRKALAVPQSAPAGVVPMKRRILAAAIIVLAVAVGAFILFQFRNIPQPEPGTNMPVISTDASEYSAPTEIVSGETAIPTEATSVDVAVSHSKPTESAAATHTEPAATPIAATIPAHAAPTPTRSAITPSDSPMEPTVGATVIPTTPDEPPEPCEDPTEEPSESAPEEPTE